MSASDDIARPLSHPRLVGIPAFTDNVIWAVLSGDGKQCLVVDPGDAEPVQQWLSRTGCRLAAILVTHHHADHCGGVGVLKHGQLTVYGPRHEAIDHLDILVEGDEVFDMAALGVRIEVIDVPGHTRGHVAYVLRPLPGLPAESGLPPLLFCGDTLFSAGCGRLFEGTAGQMFASLQKLDALPAGTLVCCAHEYTVANLRFALAAEPENEDVLHMLAWADARRSGSEATLPSSLARERRINPFLRASEPGLRSAVAARGEQASSPAQVFAALRRWKDVFR